MDNITIDSEFQSLIPPLTDDEYQRLEKSILSEGVREPIITWNGTIIDGHNRYKICTKHGLVCQNREREFDSRDAAKIWICENQLGRRNLEPGQKAALVIERSEAEVREAARLRKGGRPPKKPEVHGPQVLKQPEQQKGRTHEILAKQAGVSEATVKRVMGVKRKDPELYEKVKSGEVSARDAYRRVTSEKPKTTDDGRRICSICGEPIDEGGHYTDKLNWHYKCGLEREIENQRKYRDAGRTLRENKPTFTLDLLLAELTWNAEKFIESWTQSIEIYESTGVKLRAAEKIRLEKAAAKLLVEINKIKERTNNA